MRTLVISDLHLGSASGADVLRQPRARERLLTALSDIDRLVLLGDVLELRHGPRRDAMTAARPFFEELGIGMAGKEIVLLCGNHDHAIVEGWLQRRSAEEQPSPLALEQRIAPQLASPIAQQLAEWAAPAQVQVSFPGVWLRKDVYAMHGHYLDAHITVPTMERLAVSLTGRLLKRSHESLASVEDYEAVTAPIYAWIDAVAAHGATRSGLNGSATMKMWRLLHGQDVKASRNGRGEQSHAWRSRMRAGGVGSGLRSNAVRRGFPVAVAALNRAGFGPLRANVSGPELRRAGLSAIGEVAARLGLGDVHLVFGHTHRAGPLRGDDSSEWRGRLGARLINTGSWTYNAGFLSPGETENPYWPGSCVLVDDDEQAGPQLMRLLEVGELSHLAASSTVS